MLYLMGQWTDMTEYEYAFESSFGAEKFMSYGGQASIHSQEDLIIYYK